MSALVLHDYWRSGACYRVRIALGLKGLAYRQVGHDLRAGAQADPGYAAVNPQHLVPALEVGGQALTQSLAIIEWLDETYPEPRLLPTDPHGRALVRAMAQIVCCDVHPLNNLRVLDALRGDFGADQAAIKAWTGRWIHEGLTALETQVARHGGHFCFGDEPTLADCCLVPQLYSARRFEVALGGYPALTAIAAHCESLDAFRRAHPDMQAGSP